MGKYEFSLYNGLVKVLAIIFSMEMLGFGGSCLR